MKIVSYNIQFGLGKDSTFDLERIANEIDGADIIALQEVERYWLRSGNIDQPEVLAKILKNYYWAYGPYFDFDASQARQDGSIKNIRRQFGNMILSKTPIISTRLFPLPKTTQDQRHNMVVGVFEGVIKLANGGALRIYNAHLSARSKRDRIKQINLIKNIIKAAPAQGGTWTGHGADDLWAQDGAPPPMPKEFMLLGDFNLEHKDPEYKHIVRGPDNKGKNNLIEQGFYDTWVISGHQVDEGITFSYDPQSSEKSGMRVDYAFVDNLLKNHVKTARIDEDAQGSDHQPYWIELSGSFTK